VSPCLLDICALYGTAPKQPHDCATSLPAIIQGLIDLRVELLDDLADAAGAIADNLSQVVEACGSAALPARKNSEALQSVADGITYLRDACLTLCALLRAHPPCAGALLRHGASLIEALGAVHDQLVPSVHSLCVNVSVAARGEGTPDNAPLHALKAQIARKCNHLELATARAVELLLVHAYLEQNKVRSSRSIVAPSNVQAAGGSSFPSSQKYASGAVHRGEALLNALTMLGHRESGGDEHRSAGLALGPALAQRHGFAGRVRAAVADGILALDDAQMYYVAALLDVASLGAAPAPLPVGLESNGRAAATAVGGSTSSGGGGGGVANDEGVSAEQMSLISQVRDLLPDYGEGFIAACLDSVQGDAERAINALLEGSLPDDVATLDPGMSFQQYQDRKWHAAARALADRKGKAPAAAVLDSTGSGLSSMTVPTPGMRQGPTTSNSMPTQASYSVWNASVPQTSASDRRKGADTLTAKYLDAKDADLKRRLLAAASDAQWEYEDEYDDSFDELLHIGADGLADVEGEEDAKESDANANAHRPGAPYNLGAPGGTNAVPMRQRGGGRAGAGAGGLGDGRGQPRGRGGARGRGGKAGRLWVLEGRVYNYAKPGAKEVESEAEAQEAVREAHQAAQEIHGLGPGGNRGMQPVEGGRGGGGDDGAGGGGVPRQQKTEGGSRGGGAGRSGGRGRGDQHRWKDKNKSAIGNHHRKDRAANKMSRGMQ
jgi:activating signal cointegrator complex subunit 2